ncbi:MAG: hypothetical protein ACRCZ2_08755 [Fusobacteriaceae bacterium]
MEPINIKSELSNYRKAYGLVREDVKKDKNPNEAIWSQEQVIPEGNVQPAWGARMELPEELPTYSDERVSGDPAVDAQAFEEYLGQHPFAQEKGEDLLKMVEELSKMVQDPSNPMTLEDAMAEYTSTFKQGFDEYSKGGNPNVRV